MNLPNLSNKKQKLLQKAVIEFKSIQLCRKNKNENLWTSYILCHQQSMVLKCPRNIHYKKNNDPTAMIKKFNEQFVNNKDF